MQHLNSVFFSSIYSRNVYDRNNYLIGKVKDIIALAEEANPKVVAVQIKKINGSTVKASWSGFEIIREGNNVLIRCRKIKEFSSEHPLIFLGHHVLDKQIVDINGKKVVRVNDIQLAEVSGELRVVAADIGFSGLLRRLGVEKVTRRASHLLGKNLKDNLIVWDSVETLNVGNDAIKLTVPYKKLKTLHPADIADIIESLDSKYGAEVLEALGNETAADTLEEIEHDVQVSIIDNLDDERASEILENMDADEAADILEDLEDEHVEKILSYMDEEDSEEIRELMEYEEDTVGSIMTTEYFTFTPDLTVEATINELRIIKPPADMTYYIYVINDAEHLVGVISIRDLIVSDAKTKLSDIMVENIISIKDTSSIKDLTKIVAKYSFLAVPVINSESVLVGIAIVNDLVYEILLNRKRFS